jgi:AraC-like DNA-binding protein
MRSTYPAFLGAEPSSDRGFLTALRAAIDASIRHGHPDIARTAKAIGVSVRTLQRRLADRGMTYRRVVDQVRFRAARDLLSGSDEQLAKIAQDLGFADASSFTRAFGRWTGMAPIVFRRNARGGRGPSVRDRSAESAVRRPVA